MRTRIVAVPLAGLADTAGGIGAWQNPEGVPIVIQRLEIVPSVVATAAATLSAGTTAVSAATLSANLIDTADIHTAFTVLDNITDKGSGGKSRQTLAPGKWVTFSTASGAAAGFVGTAYIHYHRAS